MIILAGSVIMAISGEISIINKAEEVSFDSKIQAYQEELTLSILEENLKTTGKREEKFNATGYNEVHKIIPSFKRQDADEYAIQNDKLIYIGKDEAIYREAIEKDMLPEGELLDDEILTELQPFITEWTVEAGDSITLPLHSSAAFRNYYDFTVDYGDSTGIKEVTSATDEDRIHSYENAGTYTVIIKGSCPGFLFSIVGTSKEKITKIVQWGSVFYGGPSNGVDFNGCINLKGQIPEPSKSTFANINFVQMTSGLFRGCTGLTGSIPEDLFANCKKLTNFSNIFLGCTSLTGSIPENLFANCENVESFEYAFAGCTGLTGSIPEDLFANCPEVTTFGNAVNYGGLFFGCSGLTGSIPEGLFRNNTKVTSFARVFRGCSKLTGEIPKKLFYYNTEVTNLNMIFLDRSGLNGTISENMFENNQKIVNVSQAFQRCSNLTGTAPKLWEREQITSYGYCFLGCNKLDNFSEIPSAWK